MHGIDRPITGRGLPGFFRRLGGLLLAAALLPAPGIAGPDCYRARVPGEFALPDGSLHPQGELRICKRSRGSDLHLVRIDGHPVGVFSSREGRRINGGDLPDPVVFVFIRDADAGLALAGFAQRNDGLYRVFHLTHSTEWVQALKLDFHDAGSGRFVRIAAGP